MLEGRGLAAHLSRLKGPHELPEWGQDHKHLRPGHLAAFLLPMTQQTRKSCIGRMLGLCVCGGGSVQMGANKRQGMFVPITFKDSLGRLKAFEELFLT